MNDLIDAIYADEITKNASVRMIFFNRLLPVAERLERKGWIDLDDRCGDRVRRGD